MSLSGTSVLVAPQKALLLVAGLGILGVGLMLWLYLQGPYLGLKLQPEEQGLRVVSVSSEHANAERVREGQILQSLDADNQPFSLTPTDLTEEPATLVSPNAFADFLGRQQTLYRLLNRSEIKASLDGRWVGLEVDHRRLSQVPLAFWVQCISGWLCLIIGTAVLVFQQHVSNAVKYFFAAGIAIYLAAISGAVYATRELALDPVTLRLVLATNHAGSALIVACLVGLIWNYPYQLRGHQWLWGVFALAAVTLVAEHLDPGGIGTWLLYCYFTLGFTVGVVLAFLQWRHTRRDPVNRATMSWFLLGMFVGVVTPSLLIVVPALFNAGLPATHSVIFSSLLVIYLAVSMGVSRFRLFELDLWWYRAWGWFLGGLSILLVDVLLISIFQLNSALALTLAVALVGWLYFPIRQWLLQHFLHSGNSPMELALDQVAATLSGAADEAGIIERWPDMLRQVFGALEVEPLDKEPPDPVIIDRGTALSLPALEGGTALSVRHPKGGSRLFNKRDLRLAELLLGLMRRATQTVRAREEGAEAERTRIRRDMHDDLGAHLLDMTHQLPDETSREMAREATGQLRTILSAMGDELSPILEALALWETECRQRLEPMGIKVEWKNQLTGDIQLNTRQRANIGSILREATNNIIRHSGASTALYHFSQAPETSDDLQLGITDDGHGMEAATQIAQGLGLTTMQTRAQELGGQLEYENTPRKGLRLWLRLPIKIDVPTTL